MRVSWLRGLVCSAALLSGLGCEEETHVVGALADGSTAIEDASTGGEDANAGGEDASGESEGGGSTGIPAECNLPPCMARLFSDCSPSGACTTQGADMTAYVCYGNGVEISSVYSSTGVTIVTNTSSKNGATCWVSRTYRQDAAPSVIIFEDGAGIQVVKLWQNEQTLLVATCMQDGSSTVINQACDLSKVFFGDLSTCVPGTCPA